MNGLEWLSRPALRQPAAVLAFEGWGDAGDSSSDAAKFLVGASEAETIARLEPDLFFDYQVRRPVVSIDRAGVRSISWPTTELVALRRPEGDLVVVLGEEPNYRWKSFTTALADALIELGVSRAVAVGAFVGQVAHTLPVPLIGSASTQATIASHGLLPSNYEGPTGIIGVLTQALAQRGLDTVSVWAAVPHYLSNQSYPPAVEALVRKVSEIVDLDVETAELVRRSARFRATVDAAVEQSDELAEYVHQLETDVPEGQETAADLVEEIERYLRGS